MSVTGAAEYRDASAREQCVLVDEQNNVVGAIARADMRRDNRMHRATYIFVFDEQRARIVVQRRTDWKDYCPGKLDACFGGVVAYGESYEENARREIKEEIGLDDVALKHHFTGLYTDDTTNVWGDIWSAQFTGDLSDLRLQPEEVASVQWVPVADHGTQAVSPDEFTPDSLHFLRLLLSSTT
ncbi:Nudix hydrolase domain-containing protein [Plasmodiophora brassicae]|uniref:Nudix hydrolase domain-containing protein n=1 Tax=Plasmodiophora brassicae TaxID=37360 RepID=A0A0G4IJ76_PLABS|nr:hypothetical protein PBRA_003896 [Plasmodiophora brassicae]SPQ96419.1 unnamed protein product [Plasmodiophora brassicae]